MGSSQSVRATHFEHPSPKAVDPVEEELSVDSHQHIIISHKMVERLVEDAALLGNTSLGVPNLEEDDKIYIEKLKILDDEHSQKYGITVDNLNALITRVEKRIPNIEHLDPICTEYKNRVIKCYTTRQSDDVQCWDAVEAFTACLQEAGKQRLRAHIANQEANEKENKYRRVARARHFALRDLDAPVTAQ